MADKKLSSYTAKTTQPAILDLLPILEWNGATYDNKTITGALVYTPRKQSVVSAASITPTFSNDIVDITAIAQTFKLENPTGTTIDGMPMLIRIKDDGTARSIAYGTKYRAIGVTLPTTTVISKTLFIGMVYNANDTKWDVLGINQEV